MQTGREFFIHGLTDIYDAEQQLVEALGELEQDSKPFATEEGLCVPPGADRETGRRRLFFHK